MTPTSSDAVATANNDIVLSVQKVGITYGETEAIRNHTFEIRRGEFVAIVGPSGCGKSTMLNAISGLLPPTHGTISVQGKRLYGPEHEDPHLGYVFQAHRLLPWRTVKQNLELVLASSTVPRDRWDADIDRLLDILQIRQFKDSWPMRLSGGQRQRVSIARALLIRPAYVLMDEPLATLDEVTARTLRQELSWIWEQTGQTIIFVTHSLREAVFLADRIIILSRGPSSVFMDYKVPLARPRNYEDPMIGRIEADIVQKVLVPWGLSGMEALH
ncbi:MAG: ABC transporter ATP-binding protein [Pseudochelatococcus sp.]|jgi:NitT/TauT family transport system ATP-binding protein|uniref:ABC transporter ATP-binding protein n=1 Tax=Pseudochelatococcus sp. TaxID=2020869 RepID=UPI003D9169C4